MKYILVLSFVVILMLAALAVPPVISISGSKVFTNDVTVPGIYPIGLMGNRTAVGLVSPSPSFNIVGADFYTNVPFFGYQYRTIIDVANAVNGNFGGHINSAISGANVSLGLNANGWVDNSSITFASQNDTNSGSFSTLDLDSGAAAAHVFVGSQPNVAPFSYAGFFQVDTNGVIEAATNAITSWPRSAAFAGGFAIVNSNGTVYILTSSYGSTVWAHTNKIAP